MATSEHSSALSTAQSAEVLTRLADVIESRKQASPDTSYVAKLFHKGTDTILKKVGEESAEFILSAKDFSHQATPEHQKALVGECADLWFHALVALAHFNLRPEQVLGELARREGLSGLVEFANRNQPPACTE